MIAAEYEKIPTPKKGIPKGIVTHTSRIGLSKKNYISTSDWLYAKGFLKDFLNLKKPT